MACRLLLSPCLFACWTAWHGLPCLGMPCWHAVLLVPDSTINYPDCTSHL
jgi:hypothetical protein